MSAPSLGSARHDRFARVRARMDELGMDALLLSLGADLPWLSGYEAMPLERPTVLVVPRDDAATLVVPELEAPRVRPEPELFSVRPWRETEDAVAVIAGLIGARQCLAISDRAWAGLLIDLRAALPSSTEIGRASLVTGPLRARKDAAEVAALAAAGAAADRVAEALLGGEIPLIGRTEAEVSAELSRRLLAEGHSRVNFAIVGSGPNAASPHHEAGARRIAPGETVVCDFGGTLSLGDDVGYCSDTTRTVLTGAPDAQLRELYEVLQDAQASATGAVMPGMTCGELDAVARDRISAAGYGAQFIHRTGHGIGIEEHEEPYIIEGSTVTLEVGHAFSIEPGIYLPGRLGARIEDIVVVDADGVLSCNRSRRDLTVLEC